MVQRDVQQVEHNAFWGIFKDSDAGEPHVDVQPSLELVKDGHCVAHVLGTETSGGLEREPSSSQAPVTTEN